MKKPHVVIENPCHEDWQKMTPENQGRFCQFCEKIVVDFTHMSDAEILQYFSKPRAEKTCGRFRVEQVSQPIPVVQSITPKPSKSLLHFAYLLVVVLGVGLSSCGSRENHDEIQGDTTYMGAIAIDTMHKAQESPKTLPSEPEIMGDTIYSGSDTNRKTKPVDQREFTTGPYEVPLKPENTKYIKGKVKLPTHRMGKPAIIEQVHPKEEPKVMGECIMPYEEPGTER